MDTDLSGRIHYTAAMRFFEAAEHALMRGVMDSGDEARPLLPRVHVEADYEAVLSWEDEIDCTVRVASVGRTSITYYYEITRVEDQALAVKGKIVAVAINDEGKSIPLSRSIRTALSQDKFIGIA